MMVWLWLIVSSRAWNFSAPLSDMVALQKLMTNVLLPQLETITPGSGCYLNEVSRSSGVEDWILGAY